MKYKFSTVDYGDYYWGLKTLTDNLDGQDELATERYMVNLAILRLFTDIDVDVEDSNDLFKKIYKDKQNPRVSHWILAGYFYIFSLPVISSGMIFTTRAVQCSISRAKLPMFLGSKC